MVQVIATQKGYFGGSIREVGESFDVPDELWQDKKRRPSWAKLDPGHVFGGKGDHDGDGKVGGSKPAPSASAGDQGDETITIPTDWQSKSAAERKALAKAISGQNVPNALEADKIILAYIESNKPVPFGDAPEPQAAGNGVQEALGGPAPDWIAPGPDAPSQVD